MAMGTSECTVCVATHACARHAIRLQFKRCIATQEDTQHGTPCEDQDRAPDSARGSKQTKIFQHYYACLLACVNSLRPPAASKADHAQGKQHMKKQASKPSHTCAAAPAC
eukprot:1153961-Pelagomonas_calceolata.AAC.1